MNITSYESDIVAWAREQAALIRAGRFEHLDLAHIADEIEDVGKSETRELANRMAVLLGHLLKWQYQPKKRETGFSWILTIKDQRKRIAVRLKKTPSLQSSLHDQDWIDDAWSDALALARKETGLEDQVGHTVFPEYCPWSMADVLQTDWLPEDTIEGD